MNVETLKQDMIDHIMEQTLPVGCIRCFGRGTWVVVVNEQGLARGYDFAADEIPEGTRLQNLTLQDLALLIEDPYDGEDLERLLSHYQ